MTNHDSRYRNMNHHRIHHHHQQQQQQQQHPDRIIIVFTSSYVISCGIVLRALQLRRIDYIEIDVSSMTKANGLPLSSSSFLEEYYNFTNGSYAIPKLCLYYPRRHRLYLIHGVDDILCELRRCELTSRHNIKPFHRYDHNNDDDDHNNHRFNHQEVKDNEDDEDDGETDSENESDDEKEGDQVTNANDQDLISMKVNDHEINITTSTTNSSISDHDDDDKEENNVFDSNDDNSDDKADGTVNIPNDDFIKMNEGKNDINNSDKEDEAASVSNENDKEEENDTAEEEDDDEDNEEEEEDDEKEDNPNHTTNHENKNNNITPNGRSENHHKAMDRLLWWENSIIILDRWLSLLEQRRQNQQEQKEKKTKKMMKELQEQEENKIKDQMKKDVIPDLLDDHKSQSMEDDHNDDDGDDHDDDDSVKLNYNIPDVMIELYDGYTIPYCILIEELKSYLHIIDLFHPMFAYTYKNIFTGYDLEQCIIKYIIPNMIKRNKQVKPLSPHRQIYRKQLIMIGKYLLESQVIHFLNKYNNDIQTMMGDMECYLRLQCYYNPRVINSYHGIDHMIQDDTIHPLMFVKYILQQLYTIQYDCINIYTLLIDYTKCIQHRLFRQLEHTICQFHALRFQQLHRMDMIAFALNMHQIMLVYTFMKLGIPYTEDDYLHLYQNVQMKMYDATTFTIRDWIDGILRGNRPGMNHYKIPPFPVNDKRHIYLRNLREQPILLDPQIHFALQIHPTFLPHTIPFYYYDANQFDIQLKIASHIFFEEGNRLFQQQRDGTKTTFRLNHVVGKIYRHDFIPGGGIPTGRNHHNKMQMDNYDLLESFKEYMPKRLQDDLSTLQFLDTVTKKVDIQYTLGPWTRYATNFLVYTSRSIINDYIRDGHKVRCMLARKAPKERQRVEALRQLNILHHAKESTMIYDDHTEFCDRITECIQEELVVPIVMISFIDANRQWIHSQQRSVDIKMIKKSLASSSSRNRHTGNTANKDTTEEHYTSRETSICGHTILLPHNATEHDDNDMMIIPDISLSDRFADHPYVQKNCIRFYAGVPIAVPMIKNIKNCSQHYHDHNTNEKLYNVGTLCIQDIIPRTLTDHHKVILKQYAKQIEIELINRAIEYKTHEPPKRKSKSLYQSIDTNIK